MNFPSIEIVFKLFPKEELFNHFFSIINCTEQPVFQSQKQVVIQSVRISHQNQRHTFDICIDCRLYITVFTQVIAVLLIKLDAFLLDIIFRRFDFQYNRFVAQIMIIIQQSRTDSIAPTCCIHYKMFDKTIFRRSEERRVGKECRWRWWRSQKREESKLTAYS